MNPKEIVKAAKDSPKGAVSDVGAGITKKLAQTLEMNEGELRRTLAKRSDREFVYLKRRVNPSEAEAVLALGVKGVYTRREYRRFYPAGEVVAHVIGFTDVDDRGQEGVELAYNDWLQGSGGSKRVIKDRLGRIIEDVESIKTMRPGKPLSLSIDRRIQYLAYRELKAAIRQHKARSGSVVVMDSLTVEVLALVNQPSFNPNNRRSLNGEQYRNRALTDVFEPGSTVKPFTIAAALENGKYRKNTLINTSPGFMKLGRNTIRDSKDYGVINVKSVITKSSNIGASKIALSMEPEELWSMFEKVGFGSSTGSGFPGESAGLMKHHYRWHDIERATFAFGYGLSVTPLQLAQAYTVLASDGVLHPVSFLKLDPSANKSLAGKSEQVMSPSVARQVRSMLETVVSKEGTGIRASVPNYRVAGKTGTVHKSIAGGYADDRYVAVFAGMAPASRPRLVMSVMINEPSNGVYYGGEVAAPVFSKVMEGALRLLDIPPDNLPDKLPVIHTGLKLQRESS
jgi:cell division protein FtsI (penicillin-binding protein 3)